MRSTHTFLPLALVLALPSLASASCYSIYDAKNQLAFQSAVSPIDLSTRISQAMRERFPGGHLIIVPDDSDCREYRTGPVLSPRFDPGKAPEVREEMLTAPLLRSAPPPVSSNTGNNLTIRKP